MLVCAGYAIILKELQRSLSFEKGDVKGCGHHWCQKIDISKHGLFHCKWGHLSEINVFLKTI